MNNEIQWINQIYSYLDHGDRDAVIDLLFDTFEKLYIKNIEQLNNILQIIDLDRLDSYVLFALLCLTFEGKERLSYRSTLVQKIENRLKILVPDRVEKLMSGLR